MSKNFAYCSVSILQMVCCNIMASFVKNKNALSLVACKQT